MNDEFLEPKKFKRKTKLLTITLVPKYHKAYFSKGLVEKYFNGCNGVIIRYKPSAELLTFQPTVYISGENYKLASSGVKGAYVHLNSPWKHWGLLSRENKKDNSKENKKYQPRWNRSVEWLEIDLKENK